MKIKHLLLLAALIPLTLAAQPAPEVQWILNYGDDGFERALSVRPTPDGGVIVAGDYTEVLDGPTDMIVAKLSADGVPEWVRPYGYPDKMETAFDVRPMADGGYTVIGFTGFGTGGVEDLGNSYIVRTDADGDTVWTRVYDFGGIDDVLGVVELAGGDIMVAITTEIEPTTPVHGEVMLMKLTADGDSLWTRVFHHTDTDWVNDLIQTSDGGFAVTGIHNPDPNSGQWQGPFAMKFNADAEEEWFRLYNWPYFGFGYGIIEAEDEGFYICGMGFEGPDSSEKPRITKVDAEGDTVWSRLYDVSPASDFCMNAAPAGDGGVLLAVSNYAVTNPPQETFSLVKVNAAGELMWQAQGTATGHLDMATSVCATADGGYVLAGVTFWPLEENHEIGNMYVVKFGPTSAAPGTEAGLPQHAALAQNYPNPFNPQTEIRYTLPQAATVRLAVYDPLGREIATLVDGLQPAGEHSALFDGSGLAGGIYFYRLEAGLYRETRRMVLLK